MFPLSRYPQTKNGFNTGPANMHQQNQQTDSRRFIISLLLILVSFLLLFFISYKSLRVQQQLAGRQNIALQLARLNQISGDFFNRLQSEPIPEHAIPLPLARPAFPDLAVPESTSARETFLRVAIDKDVKQMLLIEAELNAPAEEQNFWRFLLLKDYFLKKNYFQMRRVASLILNSNFDYLLETGRTMKTETVFLVAEAFLRENNPEAFRQWILRLRALPAPNALPVRSDQWFSSEPPAENKAWLDLLLFCYQISYSDQIKPGWAGDQNSCALIVQHKTGPVAFPAATVISALHARFVESGFTEIPTPLLNGSGEDMRPLAASNGLWVKPANEQTSSIPGGFVALIILTSLGILGLFSFALYEWQFMAKARLLDEEEQFFRQTAHDLKTPMTIVSFLAETLALRRYKSDEQYDRYLVQLQNETQKASELFDRLLLSVRLRKKSLAADLKSLSPADTLKSLLVRFRARMPGWETVEQFEQHEQIVADPDMFERVMINLVENVLRHADDGKTLFLRICTAENSAGAQIAVMIGDNGSAFPLKIEADARYDLLTSTLPYRSERGGSGTGLFLVRQIMLTHGGQFYATPKKGGGIWMVTTWRTADK